MAIREFLCLGHGRFESNEAVCPHGCRGASVEQKFYTAPAIGHRRTRLIDNTLKELAASAGLTDMSNRSGSVLGGRTPPPVPRDYRELLEGRFAGTGQVTPAGNYGLWGDVSGKDGVAGALAAAHAGGGYSMEAVKEALPSVESRTLIRRDHERLRVDVSKAPKDGA